MANISYVTALTRSDDTLRLVIQLLSEGVSFPLPGHRPSWAAVLLCMVDAAFPDDSQMPAWKERVWQLAEQIESTEVVRLDCYPEMSDPRQPAEQRELVQMEVLLRFRQASPMVERMAALDWPESEVSFVRGQTSQALAENWSSYVSANFHGMSFVRSAAAFTKARIHRITPGKWKGTGEEARRVLRDARIANCAHVWDVLPDWSESWDTVAFTMDFVHHITGFNRLTLEDRRVQDMLMVMVGDEKRRSAVARLGAVGPHLNEMAQRILARVHSIEKQRSRTNLAEPITCWAMWRTSGERSYIDPFESKPRKRKSIRDELDYMHGRSGVALDGLWPWPDLR